MIYLVSKKYLIIFLLISVLGGIVIINQPVYVESKKTQTMSEEKFIELATQMDDMEKYMTIESSTKIVFDKEAANKDGFSEDIIRLTEESISFQNQMFISPSASETKKSMDQFPLLKEYWDAATRYHNKSK